MICLKFFLEKKYSHKIWLVNDCCHAFGAMWNKKIIGAYGDISIYAFNISKMINKLCIKEITQLITQNSQVSKKEVYNYCLKLKNEK